MAFWADSHRPKSLAKLDLHEAVSVRLRKLVDSGDFPHLMLYGPSGSGKKTRVLATLRELYGAGAGRVRVENRSFKVKAKTVEVTTVGSNYHVEMNPSDAGINDRHVIQEVIREMASMRTLDQRQQRDFRVVVLNDVDRLSKGAQHALRRTMEKFSGTCRLVLLCESACRVMEPLRSRCLMVRVPAPTNEEICRVLRDVAAKERLQLPDELAARVASRSGRNLRKALLSLEACKAAQHPLTADQAVRVSDWEYYVDDMARLLLEEQSPARLLLLRNKTYELLSNCIPPELVMRTLVFALLRRTDDQIKAEIVQYAADMDHRLRTGSKPIFHIEAFMCKFAAVYKRWVVRTFM